LSFHFSEVAGVLVLLSLTAHDEFLLLAYRLPWSMDDLSSCPHPDVHVQRIRMGRQIAVIDADIESCLALCEALEQEQYRASPLHSVVNLESEIQGGRYRVVILDLDTLPVDNRLFRELKRVSPASYIIGLSSRPFHPNLEEAFSAHISVCLAKPVDRNELVSWLRSLCENESSSRDSPAG
jgi:DNA-binding response OmpR family regulator